MTSWMWGGTGYYEGDDVAVFKVGDRVRIGPNDDDCMEGVATIKAVKANGLYEIDFDAPEGGMLDGVDLLKGWYADSKDMTLVEADPQSNDNDYYARKFDQGKADWSLLPAVAAAEVAEYICGADGEPCPNGVDLSCVAGCLLTFKAEGDRDCLINAFAWATDAGDLAEAMADVVEVLMYGAKKYAPESWKLVPDATNRYWGAACRHLAAMAKGQETDPESGLPHVAHLRCNLLFALELTRKIPTVH